MRSWAPALVGVAVLVAVVLRTERVLDPPPATPERAAELLALHERLLGDRPRPTGSPEAAAVRERVAAALAEAGCAPRRQETWSCADGRCAWVTNLWCRLGPEPRPGTTTVLGLAHTDSVPAGPGAADDGAGVVAWVDTVRRLRGTSLRRPFVLALTDGEEIDLLGARALLRDPPFPDEIGEVVNLEARGTAGVSVLFQTVGADRSWVSGYRSLGLRPAMSSLYPAIYERMPNGTDLTVFARAGLTGVDHAFLDEVAHYHTPLDDRAHLDPRSLAQHADLAYGWTVTLQDGLGRTPQTGADLLGLALVGWPDAASPVLAVLLAAGVAAVGVADVRSGRASARGVAGAVAALGAALAGAVGLGALAWWGLDDAAGWAWPERIRALAVALATSTVLAAARAGSEHDRFVASVGSLAALGVGLAVVDARLVVLTVPAVALALASRLGSAWWPGPWPLLGATAMSALAFVPLARGLEIALGALPPLLAGAWAAASSGLLAVLPRSAWRLAPAGLAVAAVAFLLARAAPERADRPLQSSVRVEWAGDRRTIVARVWPGHTPAAPAEPERGPAPPPPELEWSNRSVRVRSTRGGTTWRVRASSPISLGDQVSPAGETWIHGAPPDGLVIGFEPGDRPEIGEVTRGLPAELPRRALVGDAVPAHQGDHVTVWGGP